MENKFLLDCTLRDGGYLNDWEFGYQTIISIFDCLVKSNIDFVEIGFLDDRRSFDENRTINPTTECYNKIFSGVNKGNTKVLAMIDFGTCDISNIEPKTGKTFIDGIRVIFKKEKKEKALAFVSQVKKLGYIVFAQMVSITAYEQKDLDEFLKLVNPIKPFAVSMVDTYGLLETPELDHYDSYLNSKLDTSICQGFHTHNNKQMAFSNASHFLSRERERDVLVDGTLFGMGKTAGNAPLELLINEMNTNYGKHYNLGLILDTIEKTIIPFKKTCSWGYQLDYFLCASHRVHPKYVFFLRKKGFSTIEINNYLSLLKGDKKLLYDESYISEIVENKK